MQHDPNEPTRAPPSPLARLRLTAGQRIAWARTWAGLSLGQASRLLLMSRAILRGFEAGDEVPQPWTLAKLAETYGVRPQWLRGDPEEPNAFTLALACRMAGLRHTDTAETLEMLLAIHGPTMAP